jgi:hypothetical protein
MQMTTQLKSAMQILLLFVLCAVFPGCGTDTYTQTMDRQWANGQLRFIINSRHYETYSSSLAGGSSRMTGQEWRSITYSLSERAGQSTTSREFLRMTGEDYAWFLLIGGSDLMIHESGSVGRRADGQFALFDPKIGKDISKPFPPEPAPLVYNRSRTACLTLKAGEAVVYDTLSAGTGEPKISERPRWTEALKRTRHNGWIKPVLTEDTQYLVLLPWIDSGFFSNVRNFNIQVLSTNGEIASWPLDTSRPVTLEKMAQRFLDAEVIDNEIQILWYKEYQGTNELRLLNVKGETVRSIKPSTSIEVDLELNPSSWNPQSNSVIFPLLIDYSIWNYASNTIHTGRLR